MLNENEISAIANIKEDVVRFAYEEAQKRMHDAITIKQQLETKSAAILAGYIAIILFFLQILISSTSLSYIIWIFALLTLTGLVIGVFFLWEVLAPLTYGAIGSSPDAWLRADIIKDENQLFLRNILYLLSYYQEDLKESDKSNKIKADALFAGIRCGVFSILTFIIGVFINKLVDVL